MSADVRGAARVTAVTVTYGNRSHYLKQVLAAVQREGVRRTVVVNNGATWNVGRSLREDFRGAVDVLDMSGNTGSAAGFGAGISRAMDSGAEMIWLLDDDNMPVKGALSILLGQYERLRAHHAADKLAVLAFRPEHQADVAMGVAPERINPRPSSFRGFHVLDIPYKLWRRTRWGRRSTCIWRPIAAFFSIVLWRRRSACPAPISFSTPTTTNLLIASPTVGEAFCL
jgi:hypothetical protein